MQDHATPPDTINLLVLLLVLSKAQKRDTNNATCESEMALTDTFIRQAKHSGAPAGDKHSDGQGLYLLITKAGKYWRMNYRFAGKQKTLSLGVYPEVSLARPESGATRRGNGWQTASTPDKPSAMTSMPRPLRQPTRLKQWRGSG
jgi:hypothetical protein